MRSIPSGMCDNIICAPDGVILQCDPSDDTLCIPRHNIAPDDKFRNRIVIISSMMASRRLREKLTAAVRVQIYKREKNSCSAGIVISQICVWTQGNNSFVAAAELNGDLTLLKGLQQSYCNSLRRSNSTKNTSTKKTLQKKKSQKHFKSKKPKTFQK